MAVQLAQYGTDWRRLRDAALRAEDLGVDAVFTWDHFFGPGPESGASTLECWTVLAALAEASSRIQLGPLVSAIGYRAPELLADMAWTLDGISGGRCILGLGTGFKERDYHEYGYEFPSIADRLAELHDGIGRIRGRLDRRAPTLEHRVPILIGSSGERLGLRIVARHADVWHTFADGAEFERKSRILDGYCRDLGRDPDEIERSVLVAGPPDRSADRQSDYDVKDCYRTVHMIYKKKQREEQKI